MEIPSRDKRSGFKKRYSSLVGASKAGGIVASTSGRSSAPMGVVPVTPSLSKDPDRATVQREVSGSVGGLSA